jgi:c-di-AMP phosphodiesterase-like protein
MPSMLLGLGKANKVKKLVLEMDNYYDVQRPERDTKVSKAVTFVIDHVLEWWTSKNVYESQSGG